MLPGLAEMLKLSFTEDFLNCHSASMDSLDNYLETRYLDVCRELLLCLKNEAEIAYQSIFLTILYYPMMARKETCSVFRAFLLVIHCRLRLGLACILVVVRIRLRVLCRLELLKREIIASLIK